MKKQLISFMLTLALLATLMVGCSSGGDLKEEKDTSDNSGEAKIKVAMVVNQKFGDNGPMDDMANGAAKAEEEFGIEVKKLESSPAAFEEDVRAMSKAGYDLIITTFPYMTDSTKLVSQEFVDTKYSAIFQFINVGDESYKNIWDTEFHGQGAFYLGGYMAGKTTKTNRIGLVIGAEEPTPSAEGNAFMRGVRDANSDATVDFAFVGSYEDPAKAKEFANAMIAKGCDIIQTNSGSSNAGVVEAAKEAGILCTGEITDFYNSYNGFYGIIGIGFGETVYQSIKMAVEGNFAGGEHGIMDLKNGGYFMDWASFERFATDNKDYGATLTEAIDEAKEMEKKIVDGSFIVEFDDKTPNWDRIKSEK